MAVFRHSICSRQKKGHPKVARESFGRGCLKGECDIAPHNKFRNCEINILSCKICNRVSRLAQ